MGPKKHPLQTEADQALNAGAKLCACGAVISLRATRCGRCRDKSYRNSEKYKAKQARYNRSEKGQAVFARYRNSADGKATQARYRNSEKGKTRAARRIRLGGIHRGHARTVEQAAIIKAHVKERLREFIARQQTRAEAEGASSGAISTQAKP